MPDSGRIKFIVVCIVCAVLGFYAAKTLFDYITEIQNTDTGLKPVVSTSVPLPISPLVLPAANTLKKQPAEEIIKSPRPALVLNGIVLSPGASYALINNKIVREGDKIERIMVVRIAKDSVELKDGDTSFKISSNAKTF